ncbi:LD-carboxypeptidase [Pelomonas sp. KK5]|uniref:S66 peptidase family protein n=1 Tax=Pelomonas sp. KK5 TaxID=1855730 RepID=UPI00097C93E8|nr:LD-carboxypeptidase [Pelomonas sp. KK5]
MTTTRRSFAQSLAFGGIAAATAANAQTKQTQAARQPTLVPRRLQPGDTVGLVSPANASWSSDDFDYAIETLKALGFQVREGRHLRSRWGKFGGTDAERAGDLNAMFADLTIAGIFAMTGGSGCNRIVDKLDYATIRRNPKYFGGFSDITCLLNAIQRQTGLVTFHAPVGESEWNGWSVENFKAVVMRGEAATLRNPEPGRSDNLVSRERTVTLRGGTARGVLVGGNLSVLASLAGSAYFPDCRGAILFIEEINEYLYRVERMLSTLRLAGAFDQLAGVVIGQFTKCEPGDGYGMLTLEEILNDYFLPLNVPVYRGAMFGHVKLKLTVPVGATAELDADARTIRLLQPATAA